MQPGASRAVAQKFCAAIGWPHVADMRVPRSQTAGEQIRECRKT
jgi:hypothetical protein